MTKIESQKRAYEFINIFISQKEQKKATRKAIRFVQSEIRRYDWGLKHGLLMDCQRQDFKKYSNEFKQILIQLKKL